MRNHTLLTATVLIFALLAVCFHFYVSDADYSFYNPKWNGGSAFSSILDENDAVHVKPGELSEYQDSMLLILAPDTGFTTADIQSLRVFLENGNSVLVADESGASNSLLMKLGSGMVLQKVSSLTSLDREFMSPEIIIVYSTDEDDPVLEDVSSVVLNRPSVLTGGVPLIVTSEFTWIDLNGDWWVHRDEIMQTYTVFAKEDLSGGELYLLTDPSLFINSMVIKNPKDNRKLIENLLSSRRNLLIDSVHSGTERTGELTDLILYMRNTIFIKVLSISLSVGAVLLLWRRRPEVLNE